MPQINYEADKQLAALEPPNRLEIVDGAPEPLFSRKVGEICVYVNNASLYFGAGDDDDVGDADGAGWKDPATNLTLKLIIEYFDKGTEQIRIGYTTDGSSETLATIVTKTNTKEWKKERIVLSNVRFGTSYYGIDANEIVGGGGDHNNADFRIFCTGDLWVKSIAITNRTTKASLRFPAYEYLNQTNVVPPEQLPGTGDEFNDNLLAGWTVSPTQFAADSGNFRIRSDIPALEMGAATAFGVGIGIWQGNEGGTYKWRAGNPSGSKAEWDGASFNVVGSITSTSGTIGGWSIGASSLTGGNANLHSSGYLLLGTSNDIVRLDAADATYRIWVGNAVAASASFRVTKAGALTSTSGTIGGWTIGSSTLSSGSITLNSATPKITLGSITDYLNNTGVFMGLSGGAYKFSVGTTTKYFAFDGTNPVASGNWIDSDGVETSLQTWKTNIVFSSASATQVNWTSGTIQLNDGRTFSIVSGNTGAMAALTYIYLDTAVSSTVLQKTTNYATAVGPGRVLIAAAQNNATGASVIPFSGQQPIIDGGAQIVASSITTGALAAGAVTAAKISVSQLSAISADMGSITAGTITAATIRTAASGARVEMNNTKLFGTDGTTTQWETDTSGRITAGAGVVQLGAAGISVTPTGAESAARAYSFSSSAGGTDYGGMYSVIHSAGINFVYVRVRNESGFYSHLVQTADTNSDQQSMILFSAKRNGQSDVSLSLINSSPSGNRINLNGAHIKIGTDNTYDIGASGANRPRDLWLGRNADITGNLVVDGNATLGDATGDLTTISGTLRAQPTAGAATFALDTSQGTVLTLANNAIGDATGNANNFSGLLVVNETAVDGALALFLVGNGAITIIAQQAGTLYSTTAGTASKINVYLSASVIKIENKRGGSRSFNIMALRTRAGQ